MRPNKSAYGVPYDLVDTSQGSAMSEMLQQLQEADTALAAMHLVKQNAKPEDACSVPPVWSHAFPWLHQKDNCL